MTKRNWKGKTGTVVALLMGTSLLMSGQAYAASEKSHTSAVTHSPYKHHKNHKEKLEQDVQQPDDQADQSMQVDLDNEQTDNPDSDSNYIQNSENKKDTKASASSSQIADQVITNGLKYKGVPYKFGSSKNTTKTFDCSSFTQRVFKEAGIELPRDSRQQSKVGKQVSKNQLQKGDLIFFRSSGSSSSRITHVAIYAGNNTLLHTYGKPGVTTTKFKGTSWEKRFEIARRVI